MKEKRLYAYDKGISKPHLKFPFGQALCPCKPQGLQSNPLTSFKVRSSDKGPNPNSGTVEQKKAVTFAFTEEAKCNGALSFTKFMSAPFIKAQDCKRDNFPASTTMFACLEPDWIFSQIALSPGAPNK